MSKRWARGLATLAMLGAVLLTSVDPAPGAQVASATAPETDPLNHAFAVYLGSGFYFVNGQRAFIFRVVPKIPIRSEEDHAFGIRFRINATIGLYDFDNPEVEPDLIDRLGSWALVPGVEFPIKITKNFTLFPFLDAGVASDTKFHDVVAVVGTGLRSRGEFSLGRVVPVLWNDLIYAVNIPIDDRNPDDYGVFRTDLEFRNLFGVRVSNRRIDFGALLHFDWYFNRVVLNLPPREPLAIDTRTQVGMTMGVSGQFKILFKFRAPRFGVTYSLGDGESTYRILFRFRK